MANISVLTQEIDNKITDNSEVFSVDSLLMQLDIINASSDQLDAEVVDLEINFSNSLNRRCVIGFRTLMLDAPHFTKLRTRADANGVKLADDYSVETALSKHALETAKSLFVRSDYRPNDEISKNRLSATVSKLKAGLCVLKHFFKIDSASVIPETQLLDKLKAEGGVRKANHALIKLNNQNSGKKSSSAADRIQRLIAIAGNFTVKSGGAALASTPQILLTVPDQDGNPKTIEVGKRLSDEDLAAILTKLVGMDNRAMPTEVATLRDLFNASSIMEQGETGKTAVDGKKEKVYAQFVLDKDGSVLITTFGETNRPIIKAVPLSAIADVAAPHILRTVDRLSVESFLSHPDNRIGLKADWTDLTDKGRKLVLTNGEATRTLNVNKVRDSDQYRAMKVSGSPIFEASLSSGDVQTLDATFSAYWLGYKRSDRKKVKAADKVISATFSDNLLLGKRENNPWKAPLNGVTGVVSKPVEYNSDDWAFTIAHAAKASSDLKIAVYKDDVCAISYLTDQASYTVYLRRMVKGARDNASTGVITA